MVLPCDPNARFYWDFDPSCAVTTGKYLYHLAFAWDFALALTLAGADGFFPCPRYPWSRASMEGRSLVPLVVPLSLSIEELIFITGESRSDREPFFPVFS